MRVVEVLEPIAARFGNIARKMIVASVDRRSTVKSTRVGSDPTVKSTDDESIVSLDVATSSYVSPTIKVSSPNSSARSVPTRNGGITHWLSCLCFKCNDMFGGRGRLVSPGCKCNCTAQAQPGTVSRECWQH